MAAAAAGWLASLEPAQRAKAARSRPAPSGPPGTTPRPSRAACPWPRWARPPSVWPTELVASGLSEGSYNTAATVIGLENVLDAREGWRRGYDKSAPSPTAGATPSSTSSASSATPGPGRGVAGRGYHVALNRLAEDGEVSASPLFLGANPATSRLVRPGVLRPLAAERDLGRELLDALAPEQRATALLSPEAPDDILQPEPPTVQVGPPEGLAAAELLPQQRELLAGLLRQYFDRLHPLADLEPSGPLARRWRRSTSAGQAGRQGQPHYYRIQGPRLLIEYDNVQNGANHVHSVWRDPEGDFGQVVDQVALHAQLGGQGDGPGVVVAHLGPVAALALAALADVQHQHLLEQGGLLAAGPPQQQVGLEQADADRYAGRR